MSCSVKGVRSLVVNRCDVLETGREFEPEIYVMMTLEVSCETVRLPTNAVVKIGLPDLLYFFYITFMYILNLSYCFIFNQIGHFRT